MDDLAICKKIAEIEGLQVATCEQSSLLCYMGNVCVILPNGVDCGGSYPYNPLTDDALNHQLMTKYKVDIQWEAVPLAKIYDDPESDPVGMAYDENPNKAILLAIIGAHNEQVQ